MGAGGPPATPKQVSYLQALLENAGYTTFREARRAYGLTQRQAGGKFTKQEASALIDRIVNGEPDVDRETVLEEQATASQAEALRGVPAAWLADELRRRGWTVGEP